MTKSVICSKQAPAAIGPYSQAIQVDSWLFTSGQIALHAESGEFLDGSIQEQTHLVFKNLKAVLAAAGASLEQVVKTTVYLADMNEFAAMNEVYAEYFTQKPPARATVQAAALPKNAKVEIDAIVKL